MDDRLIRELRAALTVPLVLHGSSGVPARDLAAAVACGMVKINIGTLLNVAFTSAVRAGLARAPELVDQGRNLAPPASRSPAPSPSCCALSGS